MRGIERQGGKLRSLSPGVILVACFLVLSGCQSKGMTSSIAQIGIGPIADEIPAGRVTTDPRRLAKEGLEHLDNGKLEKALDSFNKSLQIDGANSTLNFLTGLTYHLMALEGADAKFDLAEQGYNLAIKFDRSNWIAHFHSGLLRLDRKDFQGAQERFAEALIYKNDEPELLYHMAASSYYVGDVPTAVAVLEKLSLIEPDSIRTRKAQAITFAALDETGEANKHLRKLAASNVDPDEKARLEKRIDDWRGFHRRYTESLLANAKAVTTEPEAGWQDTGTKPASPVKQAEQEKEQEQLEEDADEHRMAIIDVVIIRMEENVTTSRGMNLLNGLTLKYGSSSGDDVIDGFNYSRSRTKESGSAAEVVKSITNIISIPAVTYSLNIANANDSRSEILARPSLTVLDGEESSFFSGISIKAATVAVAAAGGNGESFEVEQDVGVTLVLTPEFLDDGRIKIDVEAERTFLNAPNSNLLGFTAKLETSRTTVHANVVMNFGETLILSGLSEKETSEIRDGVPFLQDIPIIQYAFSKKTTQDFNRSVLLLITPHQAEYVYMEGDNSAETAAENSALTEFRARYTDWFKPHPGWASIFHQMQRNSLYREFRTGDVDLERWEGNKSLGDRLKNAIRFLYY